MNRFLHLFNLLGIFALAILCAIQWRTDHQLNLQTISLEQTTEQQASKIADQEQTIKGCNADLDELRRRITISEGALAQAQDKLAAQTLQVQNISVERDKLRAAVEQWTAAVAARDDALKQAAQKIQSLADQRNQAVLRFNDLAARYNAIIKQPPPQ